MKRMINYDEIINLKNKLPLNFNEDNNLEFFRNFSSYTFKNYPAKFLKNIRISNNCVAFDYFNIIKENNQVHVLNAPSPGATASLSIAKYIIQKYI